MTIYRANCKNIFIYLASDWTVSLCLVTSYDAIQSYNPINRRIVSSLDITELKLNGSYSGSTHQSRS